MNNPYLLGELVKAPTVIERIVLAIPSTMWDQRTDPDRFSIREAVCHLADWEPIHLSRMIVAVTSPGSDVVAYDEGELAIKNGYASRDVRQELARFRDGRAQIMEWVGSQSKDTWGNIVVHPEKGAMTLYDQLNLLLAHDAYHVEHLTQFLPTA